MAFLAKQMVGNQLKSVTGAIGGDKEDDGDKPELTEDGLDPEIAELRREEEEKRKEKHRKMEEEREGMRQGIRDKYNIKKKETLDPGEDPDTAGRLGRQKKTQAEMAAEAQAAEEEEDSIIPGNIKEKITAVQGQVMEQVGAVQEKCTLQ